MSYMGMCLPRSGMCIESMLLMYLRPVELVSGATAVVLVHGRFWGDGGCCFVCLAM